MAKKSVADQTPTDDAFEIIQHLGPGLITGAADDDPSGIATYSQAGAQFGMGMLWTSFATAPMVIAIQSICARIGCVTGKGLAGNIRTVFPRWLLTLVVLLLLVANVINIAADVAAMGAAAALLTPGVDYHLYVGLFAIVSWALQLFLPYYRYVRVLKWLTLALLAYVAVIFTVKIPWTEVAVRIVAPNLKIDRDSLTMVVALLGTTISPYLFFWQSSEEVEELEKEHAKPLRNSRAVKAARTKLRRIGVDTFFGMMFANLIFFSVVLTTSVTLNAHHITNIASAAQAAEALKPIAGPFAFLIFSLGIIGTGLLAVPVLAGSAAYAVAETRGWTSGLNQKVLEAREFYAIITFAVLGGVGLSFAPLDPMKALVLSAVINGVAAVPIMAVTMVVATSRKIMGHYTATPVQQVFGWIATAVMAAASVAMFVLMVV